MSTRNHSLWEAYNFYKEALATLHRLPDSVENKKEKIEVLVLTATPMRLLGFPEGSLDMLQEGESLCKGLKDNRRLAFFYGRLDAYYAYRGDPPLGVKYSEDALAEAWKSQDIDLLVPLAQGLCFSSAGTGRYYKVVDIVPGILDLLEKTERESDFFAGDTNPYSYLCGNCGSAMGFSGNFEEGKIFLEKGLRHAAQINYLRTLAIVEYCYGVFFHAKGDWKPAIEHLQNGIKYSEEAKFLGPLAWSWALLGHAYAYLGDPERGKEYVEKGLKIQRDGGFQYLLSVYPLFLGDICLRLGDLPNAKIFMEESLSLSEKNSERHMEGQSWILLGRILGRTETTQIHNAEECMLKGMKILEELKLKPFYAQGHLFLRELYASAGQKEKAVENLKKCTTMFQEMGMEYWLAITHKVSAEL